MNKGDQASVNRHILTTQKKKRKGKKKGKAAAAIQQQQQTNNQQNEENTSSGVNKAGTETTTTNRKTNYAKNPLNKQQMDSSMESNNEDADDLGANEGLSDNPGSNWVAGECLLLEHVKNGSNYKKYYCLR